MTLAPSPPLEESSAAQGSIARRVIDVTGLSLTYETDDGPVHALSNIDLAIEAGEFVSLIGPSGCGKTTLLRVHRRSRKRHRRADQRQWRKRRTKRA